MTGRNIAVVGGGVSGITAGYVLAQADHVTLYEADDRLGGHLLHPDARGQARVPKQFYVSPFYPVDGDYRMSLPEPGADPGAGPGQRLALSVRLDRPDGHSFAASVRGRAVPATARARLETAARYPWSTAAVSARIRWQGVRLYLRGLPVIPRPAHQSQEGVQ